MDESPISIGANHPGNHTWRWFAALTAISAVIFLANTATLPLADPDEARCGSIVRAMLDTGDWLMPKLEGQLYWDKPAPFFWLASIGQLATGSMELGGRLVAALAAIACVLTTFSFARRHTSDFGAFLAGMILVGSPEFVFVGRWYRMDMPFVAAMWAALWWFWRYESQAWPRDNPSRTDNPSRPKTRWQWLGFYAFAAIATLMKGPAGLVLPVMVLAGYFLMSNPRRILGFFNLAGIIAFAVIVGPFYTAVCLRYPQYAQHFLLEQNVSRFADSGFNHHTLYGIGYVLVMVMGMAMWSVYLPGVIGRSLSQAWRQRKNRSHLTFLWAAALIPFVFFSVSRTQLPNYIVPCFPPLAVLIGLQLAQWATSSQADRLFALGARALCIVTAAMALTVVIAASCCAALLQDAALVDKNPARMIANIAHAVGGAINWQLLAIVIVVLAIIAMMIWQLRKGYRRGFLLSGLAANVILLLATFYCVFPNLYAIWSFRDMGLAAKAAGNGKVHLCSWGEHKFSLALYADADFSQKVSSSGSKTIENLLVTMTATPNMFCLLDDPKDITEIETLSGRKVQTVSHKGHYYLVRLAGREKAD